MSPRARKLVGGAGMILFVIVYALIAMALADSRPVQSNGAVVQAVVYCLLGLAWVPPLFPVIVWMEGGRRKKADAA
jgi:hypothetical protein